MIANVRVSSVSPDWMINMEVPVSLLRDSTGKPTHILALVTGITGQKLSEAALTASEERFRGIFEHAGMGIAIADMEGRFQTGNPAYCSILGYTKEELRELTIHDLMHPEDFEECMSNFRRLVAQEIPSFETLNRYIAKRFWECCARPACAGASHRPRRRPLGAPALRASPSTGAASRP